MISLVILKTTKAMNPKTEKKTRDEDIKVDNKCIFIKIILTRVRGEIEP